MTTGFAPSERSRIRRSGYAAYDEATVFAIGAAYEAEAGWHRRRPLLD